MLDAMNRIAEMAMDTQKHMAEKLPQAIEDLQDAVADQLGPVGDLVEDAIGNVSDAFRQGDILPTRPFLPGIIDRMPLPFPPGGVIDGATETKPVGATGEGVGGFQPLVDDIGRLNGEINELRQKLETASPEERMTIALELQAKQQERLQLMTTISNLLKQEHDAQMAVVNNLR